MKHGLYLALVAAFAMSCAEGNPLITGDEIDTSELQGSNPPPSPKAGTPNSPNNPNGPNDPNSPTGLDGQANSDSQPALNDSQQPVQQQQESTPSDTARPRTAELRVRGAEIDGFLAAVITPSDLLLKVNGVAVPFNVHVPSFDLSQAGHAWKFVTFELPEGAEWVEVLLAVDSERSYFATAGEEGHIEAPGLPIMFQSPAELIEARGKLVLELDLSRSLVASAENERELLPFYRLDY